MSTPIGDGGPAFPCAETFTVTTIEGVGECSPFQKSVMYPGMTLRDWFAGRTLAGVCAWDPDDSNMNLIASNCYKLADAMLAARAAQPEEAKP